MSRTLHTQTLVPNCAGEKLFPETLPLQRTALSPHTAAQETALSVHVYFSGRAASSDSVSRHSERASELALSPRKPGKSSA